jgi:uncharacterized membrane protein YhaH (DUF805 family)
MNNCFNSALIPLKKYWYFKGRASRKEFWCFALFFLIIHIIAFQNLNDGAYLLFSFFLAPPAWGVAVRRLYDMGKSSNWVLLAFIPYIGPIILLIWFTKDSQPGENKYGPNPKEIINEN